MYARACRLAVAALPLLLGACASVGPRPDAGPSASSPAPGGAHAGAPVAAHPIAVPHRAVDVPSPALEDDWSTPNAGAADDGTRAFTGPISWYGRRFAGRRTASGERFDPKAYTMAHRLLPFGTRVRVTNPANGRSVVVRVNDRGPFTGGRVADLSHAAARGLGMVADGVIVARLEVLDAERDAGPATELASSR